MNPYVGAISGMKLASGRATWESEEDGKGYWSFKDVDSFNWFLTPQQIAGMKVNEQDLLDCIEQAEKDLGEPKKHRLELGLQPDSGYSTIGASYVSRTNKHVVCVFTPTSFKFQTHNPIAHDMPPVHGYFEWYYSDLPLEIEKPKDLVSAIKQHDTATGSRATNVTVSPTIPSYNEAYEVTDGIMGLQEREDFLNQVWQYHKTMLPGYKVKAKANILETWERVNRIHRKLTCEG